MEPPDIWIIPPSLYDSPIWHPSGRFIGFNHTPLKSVHYSSNGNPDRYELETDSAGFWLINPDGTNMHRIFSSALQTPAWSGDGQWVVFVSGAQIFKMRFSGSAFDTTTLTQLTFAGRNFFPAWSPDGRWIAFSASYPEGYAGIWIIRPSGFDTESRQVSNGVMPSWSPDGAFLTYVGLWSEIYTRNLADTSMVTRLTSFNQVVRYARDNRSPKYSPDGMIIAFASQPLNNQANLWLMDSLGTKPDQITNEGMSDDSGVPFSWDTTGRFIVFTRYRFDQWTTQNGTLWILEVGTGVKRQLTSNLVPTI